MKVGDLNSHISDLVPNSEGDFMSLRGSLVKELFNTCDYILVNGMQNIVKGGPKTRVDPSNKNKGSVLDLVIISKKPCETCGYNVI